MMGIIVPEICWAKHKFNKASCSIWLVLCLHIIDDAWANTHQVYILLVFTQPVLVIYYRRSGLMGCPETSVWNYHYSLRNNPEDRSSHTNYQFVAQTCWCALSLKTCVLVPMINFPAPDLVFCLSPSRLECGQLLSKQTLIPNSNLEQLPTPYTSFES